VTTTGRLGWASAMVAVRPARISDAAAMGRLHVRAWQAAYRRRSTREPISSATPEGTV
jgi:hypothetical protein